MFLKISPPKADLISIKITDLPKYIRQRAKILPLAA